MKKNIKILVSTFLILSTISTVSAQPEITVTSEMTTEGIRVSGQISEVNTQKQATILVGDPENILYINQLPTDTSGNFCFDFLMPEHIQPGQYPYKIGSDTGAETFSGTLTYTALPTQVVNEFINAQIEARIENYTPSIVGTLSCGEGKTVTIEIQNTTDGTTLANDTITAADGEYQMNYQLPNLIVPKTYTITLICTDAEQTLTTMSLTIDSSTLLVTFSGTVTTANNVTINAQAESTDVTFNKSTSITGTKTISATIPNLVPNISFYLNAQGTETYLEENIESDNVSISNATLIIPDKNLQLSKSRDDVWYMVAPKYNGSYTLELTNGYTAELYKQTNHKTELLPQSEAYTLTYPNTYYIKVSSARSGTFSLSLSGGESRLSGKMFDFLNANGYYANINDLGRLYHNTNIVSDLENIFPISWICVLNDKLYFNYIGHLCYMSEEMSPILLFENLNAKYIVSDSNNLYFSNWSDGGKIYRIVFSDETAEIEKVCDDKGSWLTVDGTYIYYQNNLEDSKQYRILKTATNAKSGEALE